MLIKFIEGERTRVKEIPFHFLCAVEMLIFVYLIIFITIVITITIAVKLYCNHHHYIEFYFIKFYYLILY